MSTAPFRDPVHSATMDDYLRLMEERPFKFDQTAAEYRRVAGDKNRCDACQHFFEREVDSYKVCEVVRPVPEEAIRPEGTCKFFTADGGKFPNYNARRQQQTR